MKITPATKKIYARYLVSLLILLILLQSPLISSHRTHGVEQTKKSSFYSNNSLPLDQLILPVQKIMDDRMIRALSTNDFSEFTDFGCTGGCYILEISKKGCNNTGVCQSIENVTERFEQSLELCSCGGWRSFWRGGLFVFCGLFIFMFC